ncbi:MAG: hypothetical protein CMH50_11515 [Myxococcales bacterium]|nr:hypothetical protein [Myxococcales bacterium]
MKWNAKANEFLIRRGEPYGLAAVEPSDSCMKRCRLVSVTWVFSCLLTLSACQDQLARVIPGAPVCSSQTDCPDDQRCHQGLCLTPVARCNGDGQSDPGEACDDGDDDDRDGCTTACALAVCGDGFQRLDLSPGAVGYEACDDGNQVDHDACRNNCESARCGDGVLRTDRLPNQEGDEACDDGNGDNNDGCRNDCRPAVCGDGIVRTDVPIDAPQGEACDDGNQEDLDGCTSTCQLARCGDGFLRGDRDPASLEYEACDDGNEDNSDSCTIACELNVCGDGFQWIGEEACDDGNEDESDDCKDCQLARCGDGVQRTDRDPGEAGYEACDDGNDIDSDACIGDCSIARCGDGHRRVDLGQGFPGHEECDDGNQNNEDRCTTDCLLNVCGDGHRWAGVETCDDGNRESRDGCIDCEPARCGDGIHRLDLALGDFGYEACDDGNEAEDDACHRDCVLASCGDGIVRRDLTMGDPGFENCEPRLDQGLRSCRQDCRLTPKPLHLAKTCTGACLLRGGRVWCWGQGYDPNGQWTAAPRTHHQEPQDLWALAHRPLVDTNAICSLSLGGDAICRRADSWEDDAWFPAAEEPILDLKFGPDAASCLVTSSGAVRCFDSYHVDAQAVDGLENVIQIEMSRDREAGDALAIDQDGQAYIFQPFGGATSIAEGTQVLDGAASYANVNGVEWQLLDWQGRGWEYLPNGELRRSAFPDNAIALAGSGGTICAVMASGEIHCMGGNVNGALGYGRLGEVEGAVQVLHIDQAVEAVESCGSFCALESNGQVWCWGWNYHQLVDPNAENYAAIPTPQLIRGLPDP